MKQILLIAMAVAGVFTYSASTRADDAVMSPRAKALADSLKTVPGTSVDKLDRSIKPISPRAMAFAESVRTVPSVASTTVASAAYRSTGDDGITASPKHRQQLDERGSQVMVAPLK